MGIGESPASVPQKALVAIVLSLVMLVVAVGLMGDWGVGWGPDKKAIEALNILADAIIESTEEEITLTRLEGYFFVYCEDPSASLCGDTEGAVAGSRDSIGYKCTDYCLCVATLPEKPNTDYLLNIVECRRLAETDGGGETVFILWIGPDNHDEFWVKPEGCGIGGTEESVAESWRYTVKVTNRGGSEGECTKELEIVNSRYVGSTKTECGWDSRCAVGELCNSECGDFDDDIIDLCQSGDWVG